MARRLQDELAAFFFEYDTPRMVLVRNKRVGVVFRLIQLVVLVYVIGWVFVYEKGYQTSSGLISSVSVKLKGLAVTKLPSLGPQVWDVADYVFPAQGDGSFVVMTNFIATPRQAKGHCAENPEGGTCTNNSGCTPGKAERKAQGIRTGKCVAFNDIVHTCEIFGWCPVEVDDNIPCPALLREAENFTLFIKNSISFPRFKVTRRNLVEEVDAAYMKTCLYHKTLHPLCPVFKLGYVVQESGQNFSTLAEKGGVVGITIDWHCDLDWHVRHCKPVYEFHGLYEEKNLSQGFNFRFARHFVENGTNYRHLFKVFGIRFDILVDGKIYLLVHLLSPLPSRVSRGVLLGNHTSPSLEAAASPLSGSSSASSQPTFPCCSACSPFTATSMPERPVYTSLWVSPSTIGLQPLPPLLDALAKVTSGSLLPNPSGHFSPYPAQPISL
ncbi:P2X purinoceptor 1 isoform X3 [Physeter macrocephalus]|uniref:P2X purinoceptor n=1 Tax=Physeter macrocephalus TaxID=9755 RepID=A0A455BY67_PHYMC|nr:P2X purinoceptor 1 isoform X3 [Physeter catodon]|eukprot:XP_028353974.1 P2X purinoceptor 1 isoform X3 [Physeter catodon]